MNDNSAALREWERISREQLASSGKLRAEIKQLRVIKRAAIEYVTASADEKISKLAWLEATLAGKN